MVVATRQGCRKLEYNNLKNMTNGWFIGNFIPTVLDTKDFEVGLLSFKKGQLTDKHYHKIATEYNLVVNGMVKINDYVFEKDEIFILKPYEWSESEFLEDTEILVVKTPSVKGDKYTE